jgi:AcrR family transcriptional regulator
VARGQQTRRLLAEALVGLVDAGAAAPTTREVADRAGVSVRVVFHHFRGTEGLVVAALSLQSERHRSILFAIPPRGPPELRIRALCRQRRLYFEGLTPVYRLALARVHARVDTGAGIADLLTEDRARLRRQLTGTFAPEVEARGVHADVLLDALEQATGWEAWRALRDVRHLTPAAAERAMAFTAGHLLG